MLTRQGDETALRVDDLGSVANGRRRGAFGHGRDASVLDHDMTVAVLGAHGIHGRDVAAVEDDAGHSSSSTAVSRAASMLRIQPSLSAEFFSS